MAPSLNGHQFSFQTPVTICVRASCKSAAPWLPTLVRGIERYRLAPLHRRWLRAQAATPSLVKSGRPPLASVLARRPSHRLHRAVVAILGSQMAAGSVIRSAWQRHLVERAERTLNG